MLFRMASSSRTIVSRSRFGGSFAPMRRGLIVGMTCLCICDAACLRDRPTSDSASTGVLDCNEAQAIADFAESPIDLVMGLDLLTDCEVSCAGKECGPDGCGGWCGICSPDSVCVAGRCPPTGTQCSDENEVAWDGCTEGKITECTLSAPGEYGYFPDVAASGIGIFLVEWTGKDGDGTGIHSRTLVSGSHSVLGDNVLVNAIETGDQYSPAAVALENKGFVVVWATDGHELGLRATTSTGTPTGEEYVLHSTTTEIDFPDVAALSSNRLALVWQEGRPCTNRGLEVGPCSWDFAGSDVFGMQVDLSSMENHSPIVVHDDLFGNQWRPAIAALPAQHSVVAWRSSWTGIDMGQKEDGIWARLCHSDSSVGEKTFAIVESFSDMDYKGEISLSATGTGDVVAVWSDCPMGVPVPGLDGIDCRVKGGVFAESGTKLIPDAILHEETERVQTSPSVSTCWNGALVVVWESSADPWLPGPANIMLRRFDSGLSPLMDEVQVNSNSDFDNRLPTVACAPDGGVLVAWEAHDGGGATVMAQRFDATGRRLYQ